MMFKKCLLLSLLLICCQVSAKPAPIADELAKKLENIKNFSADFVQLISDEADHVFSKTTGQLKIHKPGKFLWKTKAPNPLLVIADGKTIWTYDIDLEQVLKQDAKQALNGSPAALLADEFVDLAAEFEVKKINHKSCQDGVEQCYLLIPKNPEALFSKVWIGFKSDKLTSMKMIDALGQHIEMRFSNMLVNTKLEDGLFIFTPPTGVDIIYNPN